MTKGNLPLFLDMNFQTPFAQLSYQAMGLTEIQKMQLDVSSRPLDIPDIFYDVIALIQQAIQQKQKIFIGGDYDADGICATSMLLKVLKKIDATVGYYIPDRFNQGYGLHQDIALAAIKKGYDCFILVDNGVASHTINKLIKDANKTLIIIDHHALVDRVNADALIHPDLLEPFYANMCASGLIAILAKALNHYDESIKQLAMVATIADMMPLYLYNRLLVKEGLKSINQQPMMQLVVLVKTDVIDEESIAFQVVPKLNAIGRLSDRANANQLVQYFLLDQLTLIDAFAKDLHNLNQQRKQIGQQMFELAQRELNDDPFVFIAHPSFHQGVVGIVAGQLMRLANRPTAIGAIKQNQVIASLRSNSLDLVSFFKPYVFLFDHFGGHAKAAGLTIDVNNWEKLKTEINHHLKHQKVTADIQQSYLMPIEFINHKGLEEFEQLAPFGQDFQKPQLTLKGLTIIKTSHHPLNKVFKWQVTTGTYDFDVISFDPLPIAANQSKLNVIGSFKKEVYRKSTRFVFIVTRSC